MRLFTHHLHDPASNRDLLPPPSMWRELRERLDRFSTERTGPTRPRI